MAYSSLNSITGPTKPHKTRKVKRTNAHRYYKAAKRKNADAQTLYETAVIQLKPKQVARLAASLRECHGFKLSKAQRESLVGRLLNAGMSGSKIAKILDLDRKTVSTRTC